ncbi:MAG: hypothetical protein K1X74_17825 [Pirellulales bacterium]|nr:hypothetical protein [Pirellulales bacterium]
MKRAAPIALGWCAWVALVAAPPVAAADPPANKVLDALLTDGVIVSPEVRIPLHAPVVPDGLDAAAQRAALESISDANHTVERLLRDAVVSPFVLQIEKHSAAAPDTTSRIIDLYFVAYGKLEVIYSESFREQLARLGESDDAAIPTTSKLLDLQALNARSLLGPEGKAEGEQWLHARFPMLDRVYIFATRHAMSHRTDESIVLASRLDERFRGDAEFPVQWQSIGRTEAGKIELGPAVPYAGGGFYVKLTRLREPAGAIFVEYHHAFVEPQGWFKGANLLRSKLPLVAQDRVRRFRRDLDAASK